MESYKTKHSDSVKITFIISATVIALVLLGVIVFSFYNPRTISSVGVSELSVVPDKIVVYFNIETKGETATEVKNSALEIYELFVVKMNVLGFDEDEIKTENFNIYPEYDWVINSRKQKGFVASQVVKIEVDTNDSGAIGNVIDAGVDAGAFISYINFELSQEIENEYRAGAMKLATEDARKKAEAIADGLGKNLGNLVSVSTSDFNYSPWKIYDSAGAQAVGEDVEEYARATVAEIQPSEQKISASVTTVWRI